MDIQDKAYNSVGLPIIKETGLERKVTLKLQPAVKTFGKSYSTPHRTLVIPEKSQIIADELIAQGESGKFDFSFLDAHRDDYPDYYEKSLQLLRPGGVIAIYNV